MMGKNLEKFKKIDDVIADSKVLRHFDVTMLRQLKKWKVFIVPLFLIDQANIWCKG